MRGEIVSTIVALPKYSADMSYAGFHYKGLQDEDESVIEFHEVSHMKFQYFPRMQNQDKVFGDEFESSSWPMGIFHVQFLRYNEETKLVEPRNRVALEGGFCRRLGPAEMVARKNSLEIG